VIFIGFKFDSRKHFVQIQAKANRQGAKNAKVLTTSKHKRIRVFNRERRQIREKAKDFSATDEHRLSQMFLSAFHLSPSVAGTFNAQHSTCSKSGTPRSRPKRD
jgi:hypothetical protein